MEDPILKVFDELDSDGSGYLEFEELKELLYHQGLSTKQIEHFILIADDDGDGRISKEEFQMLWRVTHGDTQKRPPKPMERVVATLDLEIFAEESSGLESPSSTRSPDSPKKKKKTKGKKKKSSKAKRVEFLEDLKKKVQEGTLDLFLWGEEQKKKDEAVVPENDDQSIASLIKRGDSTKVWNSFLFNRRSLARKFYSLTEEARADEDQCSQEAGSKGETDNNSKEPMKKNSMRQSMTQDIDDALQKMKSELSDSRTDTFKKMTDFDMKQSLASMEYLPSLEGQTYKHIVRRGDRLKHKKSKMKKRKLQVDSIREGERETPEDDGYSERSDTETILDYSVDDDDDGDTMSMYSDITASDFDVGSTYRDPQQQPQQQQQQQQKQDGRNVESRISSIDIVADLFAMSNELRLEREKIVKRDNSDMGAFIDRETTMKYNDMLDENKDRDKEAKKQNSKAEALRRKNIAIDTTDMSLFWSHVLNKQTVQKKHLSLRTAAKSMLAMGFTRNHEPIEEAVNEDLVVLADDDEGAVSEDKEHRMDASSILEENLGLLLKTKIMSLDSHTADSNKRRNALMGLSVPTIEAGDVKATRFVENFQSKLNLLSDKDKVKAYYGIKANYEDVKTRLYENAEISLSSSVSKKSSNDRQRRLRVLITQIATFNPNSPHDDSRPASNDTSSDRLIERIVVKQHGKYVYEAAESKSDIKYHPYYKLYAGTGRYNFDPELVILSRPYTLGDGFKLAKTKRTNKKKKFKVSYPVKVKGADCDEVLFDFRRFNLTLRSVRNNLQYDVSVGLNTLYVTASAGDRTMVTIRSSLLPGGYITTIQARDWELLADQIIFAMRSRGDVAALTIAEMYEASVPAPQPPPPVAPRQKHSTTFLTESEDFTRPVKNYTEPSMVSYPMRPLIPKVIPKIMEKLRGKGSEDVIKHFRDSYESFPHLGGTFDGTQDVSSIIKSMQPLEDSIFQDGSQSLLLPGRTAFNESFVSLEEPGETKQSNEVSAESLPARMGPTLNIRSLFPSCEIAHPKSWAHSSLYETFKQTHRPYKVKTDIAIYSGVCRKKKSYVESSQLYTVAYGQRKAYRPPLPPTSRYILDVASNEDDYDDGWTDEAVLKYYNHFSKFPESFTELSRQLRNPMRAGDALFPISVCGAKPPTVPALSRKSPNARRVKTRNEIYTQFYSKPDKIQSICTFNDSSDTVHVLQRVRETSDADDESRAEVAGAAVAVIKEKKKASTGTSQNVVMLIESRRLMQLYFAKKFLQLDTLVDVHATRESAAKALATNPFMYSLVFVCFNDLGQDRLKESLRQIVDPACATWTEEQTQQLAGVDWSYWDPAYFSGHIAMIVYGDIEGETAVMDDEDSLTSNTTEISFDTDSDFDDEVSDEEEFFYSRVERRRLRQVDRDAQLRRQAERERKRRAKPNKYEEILQTLEEGGARDLLDEPYTLAQIKRVMTTQAKLQEMSNMHTNKKGS